MYYMNVVMDADCLIKLTKAKLKETVCSSFAVVIPREVKREVVDEGRGHPDATVAAENLRRRLLRVSPRKTSERKGEEAALSLFRRGKYDAICTDDKRFVRRLRALDVPYITPAVFVLLLVQSKQLAHDEACIRLDELAPFVSQDEYAFVKVKLDALSSRGAVR